MLAPPQGGAGIALAWGLPVSAGAAGPSGPSLRPAPAPSQPANRTLSSDPYSL